MTRVLEGIRVVEVDNWGFAPSAGTVLADWGADVVKVEDPRRGDPLRGIFGAVSFAEGAMVNFLHEQWNRNKRSVGIDLATAEGRALLDDLVRSSDVFLTNYLPPLRRKFRLEPADLRAVNPSLVYALATGQGSKGPDAERPSYDYVSAWARAGVGDRLTPEGGPLTGQRAGFIDTTAGNFLAGAVAAALVRKERTGEGVDVEVSLLASGAWMIGPDIANFLTNGFELPRSGPDGRGAGPLMTWYECQDGKRLVFTMMNPEAYWPAVCRALEVDLLSDPRFDTPEKRAAANEELHDLLRSIIATRPRAEWAEHLDAEDIVWAPVQPPSEYVDDVQVRANGYLVEVEHPVRGTTRLVASPAQFDGQPIEGRWAAPEIGQHTDEVLAGIGVSADRLEDLRARGVVA
ncbi:CaiB/BaiF CoA transferase family protein [Rhabdothermincola sediminis]|uniref:CaiB/BaiF CoA transferase family protein n=1 Tax=Rhabdothermincola sediminis TaxID=2751370 RepID=UPI001AA020BF|nr:CoA transferase [Rhabdothermincola sediminis]